jgi:hypothetical protein
LNETAFLLRHLSLSSNYFEFGCGGSTLFACENGPYNLKIHSIDSSPMWINKTLNYSCVKMSNLSGRLTIRHIDIGAVGNWGIPTDRLRGPKIWRFYSESIFDVHENVDLVLVDGRFRMACVVNSFIAHPNAKVLLHDLLEPSHYVQYERLLEVADVIERCGTLCSLRRKVGVSDSDLKSFFETVSHHVG